MDKITKTLINTCGLYEISHKNEMTLDATVKHLGFQIDIIRSKKLPPIALVHDHQTNIENFVEDYGVHPAKYRDANRPEIIKALRSVKDLGGGEVAAIANELASELEKEL
ncbi:hypothetical protein N9137_01000 [Pseudomonadales bacterium]|nr:hypothetical protein [Pseudomonadales bacterium]